MRAVLISIKPKWCEKIASGEKTIEVRKTCPKMKTPFKCYIYCTVDGAGQHPKRYLWKKDKTGRLREIYWNGKVIGEFVCDRVFPLSIYASDPGNRVLLREQPFTCLTDKQMLDYLGNGKDGYGWLITDLKIWDKPKELSEFWAERICTRGNERDECAGCWDCEKRPPQSWCYVEELERWGCASDELS